MWSAACPTLHQWSVTASCSAFHSTSPCHVAGWQCETPSGYDSTAVSAAEQCRSSWMACLIPWLVTNRACFGHFGQRLRERVPQPRTRLMSMRHRCLACIGATSGHTRYWQLHLWGFIGDPSGLPYTFFPTHLVLQTQMDGFLSVNGMM